MPRTGVQYVQNEEPSFISKFKQRIGHKEDETSIDAKKKQIPNFDESDGEDDVKEKEDEKPVVVVLKKGDLTAEEANQAEKQREEGPAHLDQKITFKKPSKRSADAEAEGDAESQDKDKKKKKSESSRNSKLKEKNKSLLSFDEEEEEED